jgi:hypothetical protein
MKLNSRGVIISILILIIMMLICHTMNFFYPKNKFENIDTKSITDYNEIYYTDELNKKQLCANVNQAEIPCDIVKKCEPEPTPTPTPIPKYTLSSSELDLLYKFAYEASAREIFTRTLEDLQPTTTQPNPWGF